MIYHHTRDRGEAYLHWFQWGLICTCAVSMLITSGCSGGGSGEEDGGDSDVSSESSGTGGETDSETDTDPGIDSDSETSDASVDSDSDTNDPAEYTAIWAASCAGGGENSIEDVKAGTPAGKMWLTIGTPALGPEPAENLPYAKMYWGFGNAANEFSDF